MCKRGQKSKEAGREGSEGGREREGASLKGEPEVERA